MKQIVLVVDIEIDGNTDPDETIVVRSESLNDAMKVLNDSFIKVHPTARFQLKKSAEYQIDGTVIRPES